MSHSPQKRGLARRFAAGLLAAAMTASCIPAAFAAGNDTSKDWSFTWFGPSTSETANTVSAPDGINGKIVMTSCTANADGTIDKKGGKFVSSDPADGISFYYTTIDPAKENFYLQADVTIDYVNPTPDGQEGFALMIRDVIGTKGESASFESNLVSVTGTKLPYDGMNGSTEVKDMVGVRSYTGISDLSTVDSDALKVYRQGFDPNGAAIQRLTMPTSSPSTPSTPTAPPARSSASTPSIFRPRPPTPRLFPAMTSWMTPCWSRTAWAMWALQPPAA